MVLSFIYLVQSTLCYARLSENAFIEHFPNNFDYALELYSMVDGVCLMNIAHAITLISLGIFVVQFTRKFKILNEKHYLQLGVMTIVITLVYFIPVLIVAYNANSQNNQSEKNAHKGAISRFFDMLFYVFMRSELGVAGFILAILIHFQLYLLLFVMMWCASHVKDISDKVKLL